MSLSLYSEPFAPTGSLSAAGAMQSLGRPHMDTLAVLVREAVQNSWDARIQDGRVVEFSLNSVSQSGQAAGRWRSTLADLPSGLPLETVLKREKFDVLYVRDANTKGLTGSTRADRIENDAEMDFVDFVRNVGQPRPTEYGGGTYGYGKSIFFVTSAAQTILTYTRTKYQGKYESRLIGAALGEYHLNDGIPYTGRHWWGVPRNEILEPLLNDEADELAAELGFEIYPRNESGTTIAVVGFEAYNQEGEPRPSRQAVEVMAEAIAWHCWPKYGSSVHEDEITFSAQWDGVEVPVPDEQLPVIQVFRRALDDILLSKSDAETGTVHRIASQRPRQHLGLLALRRSPRTESEYVPWIAPFEGRSHHVALMREPKLIVKYLPAAQIPAEDVEWAGAFKVEREVDYAFAKSEPPAHDDWIAESLLRPEKVYVNVARRRILQQVDEELAPPEPAGDPSLTEPLGELSSRLGSLIALSAGTGPRVKTQSGGGGGSARRGFARANGEPRLTHRGGRRALLVPFHAEPMGDSATLVITPQVLVDGGRAEQEPPTGSELPELLEVEIQGTRSRSPESVIAGYVEGTAVVSVPDDTMVRIGFELIEANGNS